MIIVLCSACSVPESPVEVCGELVYAAGFEGILSQHLPSGRKAVIYQTPDHLWVDSVASDGEGGVFFSAGWPGKAPYTIFHLGKGQRAPLRIRRGMEVAYSTSSAKLFYYFHPEDKFAESSLFVIDPHSDAEAYKITDAPRPITLPNGIQLPLVYAPVVTAPDRAFFLASDHKIKVYEASSSKIADTGYADCIPLAYRSSEDSLLCVDWSTWDLHNLQLSSLSRGILSQKVGTGAVYIPEADSILLNKTVFRLQPRIGETSELWLRSFSSGDSGRAGFGYFEKGYWEPCRRDQL